MSFFDTEPISVAFSEFWSLSSLITLINLEVLLVTIFYVPFEGWGVSGMSLSKLSSLFNNSLLLSPTPSMRDLFFLSSLIFCLALSLILKGLSKGFSMGIFVGDSSKYFCLGIILFFIDSPQT